MLSLDDINRKYGTDTLKTARQGVKEKGKWQSLRQRVSPAYTTRWAEIAAV
jgi:DNA polymerase V